MMGWVGLDFKSFGNSWPVWMEGGNTRVKESRVVLIKNKLIYVKSTLLSLPPLQSKRTIKLD